MREDGNEIIGDAEPLSYLEEVLAGRGRAVSQDELHAMLQMDHGRRLGKMFLLEWELINLRSIVGMFEHEHSRSLALLFDNESQKMQLEDLNRKLTGAAIIREKDLKMAESVQRSLLFESAPKTLNYDIAFHYQPYASVSGDFYDFYVNENGMLTGLALVDVSGHGIASGLLTVLTKPIFFRMFRKHHDLALDKVMEYINMNIIFQIKGSDHYLTAALMRFTDGGVEYVNAAHPDILFKKRGDTRAFPLKPADKATQGAVLGIETLSIPYESFTFPVGSGDLLVIYTDCLVESKNRDDVEFGQEHAIDVVSRFSSDAEASEVLAALLSELKSHCGNNTMKDDLCIIVMKKK